MAAQRQQHPPLKPEEREKLKERVINEVRAVLLPEKHGMLLENLNREYRDIIGENIPWQKLGYQTFDDFVNTNPHLCRLEVKGDGTVWVHAVPTEETQHIRNLVSMQKNKKRASAKPKPARRPLNAQKWSPPTTTPMNGVGSGQSQSGRSLSNNKSYNSQGGSQLAPNQMSGVHYNRRYPQSGGSGRFAGGGNSPSANGKGDYTRTFPSQTQKLRNPNMGHNNIQNTQYNVRSPKQQFGMGQPHVVNNSNRRNTSSMSANNITSINNNHNRQSTSSNKIVNGNQIGIKSFPTNYSTNTGSRNNYDSLQSNTKTNYEQYKPLIQEYFHKHALGPLEYKTATFETKVNGPGGSQGAKNFRTSKLIKRYISTVKVHDKNYQTFPEDFGTSEAAEEAAAKLACIQLNINKTTLSMPEGNLNDKKSKSTNAEQKQPSLESATFSNHTSNDTDFGEWFSPTDANNGSAIKGPNDIEELDIVKFIDRILELVGKRSNGVWSTQIDVEYSQTFDDILPDKWPDKIENIEYGKKRLRVDRPIPGRCIILPNLEYSPSEGSSKTSVDGKHIRDQAESSDSPSKQMQEKNRDVPGISASVPVTTMKTGLSQLSDVLPKAILAKESSESVRVSGNNVKSQIKPPGLQIPEEELWDIYVTHVHSTMNVCLRLLGEEYSTRFDDLVTNMELHYFNVDTMPSVSIPTVGKIYAAKVDSEWHRVEITSVRGIDISCYFIDHGDEEALKATDLKELDNEFLTLAPQAKHVRLAGLEGFRDSASAIANLTSMALGRSLVGNVHTNDNDGISLVLWDTSGEDDDININETLLDKMKQNISGDDSNSLHSSMPSLDHSPNAKPVLLNGQSKANENGPTSTMPKTMIQHMDVSSTTGNPPDSQPARNLPGKQEPESYIFDLKELMNMDLSSFKPLSRAVLPDAEDFFDVTITLAGSPSNFTVQPYFEGRYLDGLQVEMNKFYNNAENHYSKGPLTSDHLSKDFFFSGRHDDGQWYRVKVNSMLDEYTAAVKLVDYGDYCMMQLENMQPLWPQFRNLAMQAISASLAGIIATHGDWTPDDAVWFAQRVVNKQFVSKIKDVIWDMNDHDACGNGFKLSLSLFDTSNPNEDVVIEKILVNAGKAVYLCV